MISYTDDTGFSVKNEKNPFIPKSVYKEGSNPDFEKAVALYNGNVQML